MSDPKFLLLPPIPVEKTVILSAKLFDEILTFFRHKPGCDWLEVNWNKGPCSCGFEELARKLIAVKLYDPPKGVISNGADR
jgi:hypothetical protein